MSNLLVTGGAGFIGSNFVFHWLEHYPEDTVVVLDLLTYAGNLQSLQAASENDRYRFVRGDICDGNTVGKVIEEFEIDTIVHFAAESHVDRSIHGPSAFIQTNIVGTHVLLDAARQFWLGSERAPLRHRFHHVSTDEVFGSLSAEQPPFTETTPYAPNSPYSASKAASDHLVRAYHHTYGLEVTTSNCSNNYGPYQFPEKLIPLMIVNALSGKQLPVYGDGSNIRDWLFVEDHVKGIDLVINSGRVGETYNFGGGEEHSNIDIVRRVCAYIDNILSANRALADRYPASPAARGEKTESLIKFVKDRPGHDWRYAIDTSKAERELGFRTTHSFETGLKRTIEWMLENEDWWRSILDKSYLDWIDTQYAQR